MQLHSKTFELYIVDFEGSKHWENRLKWCPYNVVLFIYTFIHLYDPIAEQEAKNNRPTNPGSQNYFV